MKATYTVGTMVTLALAALIAACALGPAATSKVEPAAPVSDAEIGLSKTSVFDVPDPLVVEEPDEEPGSGQPRGGYIAGSPPVITHAIEDFLPITADDNKCLGCHDTPGEIGKPLAAGAPLPIPASHYTDLRRDPKTVTARLIGTRWLCTQCHVAETEAPALVPNTYERR